MEKAIQNLSGSVLIDEARIALGDRWHAAAGVTFVYLLVSGVSEAIPPASLLLAGPLGWGYANYALRISRGQEAELSHIFDGFNDFARSLVAMILMLIAIIVGMIFFIVPGIILAIGLGQTFFILNDDKEITAIDAMKESWAMMDGYKMDYFILGMRFIPWAILCLFTLGIGFLWLIPYMQVTYAKFYDSIRSAGTYNENIDDYIVE